MKFDTIAVAVDGPRGTLELDRPDKLNPLSSHTLRELEAAARWFDGHDDLKVVVVSGRGRAFSAGADVSSFGAGSAAERSPRDDADCGWRMARAMDELRAVTVAKVRGWCVGGGLVLAACATCASPGDRRGSRSPRSSWASRWRGVASRGSCARSARRSPRSS